MKTISYILVALVLGGALATLAPGAIAIDVGCQRSSDGAATVQALPGAIALNWTPECVIIKAGETVVWQNLDAAPLEAHGAKSKDGCFNLGRITTIGATQSVVLDMYEGSVLTGEGNACGVTPNADGSVTLEYDCVLHGAIMTAQIIIEP